MKPVEPGCCGHISSKENPPRDCGGFRWFGWWLVTASGTTRRRSWVLFGGRFDPISGPVFHPADRLMLDLPITELGWREFSAVSVLALPECIRGRLGFDIKEETLERARE